MAKPKALDLFCGEGGASWGLMQAGFDVVGVDLNADCAVNYPFDFIHADATNPPVDLADFDFVWASPPCQRFSQAVRLKVDPARYPNLIPPTRELLAGHPYTAIENVPHAHRGGMRPNLILWGPMFGLDMIERKRIFELSFPLLAPAPRKVKASSRPPWGPILLTKGMKPIMLDDCHKRKAAGLPVGFTREEWETAAGFEHHMSKEGAGESIPPAYSRYIALGALRLMGRA